MSWKLFKEALGDTFSGIKEHGLYGNLEKSVSDANIDAEIENLIGYTPAGVMHNALGPNAGTVEDIISHLPGVGDNPEMSEFWGDVWNQGGLDPYQTQDLGIYGDLINMGIDIPQQGIAGWSRILSDASGVLDRASGAYSTQGGNVETGYTPGMEPIAPPRDISPVAPVAPPVPSSRVLPISRQEEIY